MVMRIRGGQGKGVRHSLARRVGFTGMVAAMLMACAPPPPPPKLVTNDTAQFADEEDLYVDVPKARRFIGQARVILKDQQDFDAARKKLREADRFANETVREEIRKWSQQIDSVQADGLTPPIIEAAKAGRCLDAADLAIKAFRKHRGNTVSRFVKDRTKTVLLDCMLGILEIDQSVARETLADARVRKVLDSAGFERFRQKVNEATVSRVIGKLKKPLERRDWAGVMKRADELRAREEIGRDEVARVLDLVRAGAREDIAEMVGKALERQAGAGAILRRVDRLIVVARWARLGEETVDTAVMPKSVSKSRDRLAFWAACGSVACRLSEPVLRYTYGATPVMPQLKPRGASKSELKHATPVWRIAESPTHSLITRSKPEGTLDGIDPRMLVAYGWVKSSQLRKENTATWLPPGAAIVGTRVWGPLRKGTLYELGHVAAVKGGRLVVKRMSDRVEVEVSRAQVNYGTVAKGTKVFARCDHPLNAQRAVIDAVISTSGDPVVRYRCIGEDGKPGRLVRQDQLASLRTKRAMLPPRR